MLENPFVSHSSGREKDGSQLNTVFPTPSMLRLHLSRELFSTYLDIAFYQNFSFACLTRKIRQKQLVLTFLFVFGGGTAVDSKLCCDLHTHSQAHEALGQGEWVPTTVPAVPFILQVSVQQGWTYAGWDHSQTP